MLKSFLKRVIEGESLGEADAAEAMRIIMSGEATPAQIAGFLVAMRLKGETATEITGFARVMRDMATRIDAGEDAIDTCGTGGDRAGTFNISTAAALVAAGMGIKVAKHGNRAVSSSAGSADVLKELGVNIDAGPEVVARCVREAGMGFLFAPRLHSAMKHAIGPRREMGVRTFFNILGPLTNPSRARRQVIGVYDAGIARTMCEVLGNLGSVRAMVVHGEDGLDEITICARTHVAELANGVIKTYDIAPEDLGLKRCAVEALVVTSAAEGAEALREVLAGRKGPRRDIVSANAAAAVVVAGAAKSLPEGMRLAAESIDSGKARKALERLIEISNSG
jgi:anthranilate phosphoribosyltransferase